MTTAHRPTFDHLKGRLNQNKTHITHKRFLPLHTQLKYRHSIINDDDDEYETAKIDLNKLKKSVEELKLELINKEQEHYKDAGVLYQDRYLKDNEATKLLITNGDNETFEERRQRILEETRDIDGSSSSESESEEESDEDETELLLKELEKLKQEKQELVRLEKKDEITEKLIRERENGGITKSWRNETVFSNRHKKRETKDDNFVNDMLRNEFHKKFMDKYVK